MKKITAFIGAVLSLLPIGHPLFVGTGAVLTSAAVTLSASNKANAESADFYFNQGIDKFNVGDYYGAISDYTKTLDINPKDGEAYYNRGLAKYNLKDYSGAISDYTKTLDINPKDAEAYNNRGIAKFYIDDKKGGCKDFKKATSLGKKSIEEWLESDDGAWCRNM